MKFNSDVITSRNNPLVKWAASLSDKKGRSSARSFIAEGEKLTLEALKSNLPITHIFLSEKKATSFIERISQYKTSTKYENTQIICLSESTFDKISTEKSPEGVISVIKYLDFFFNIDIIYKEEFFVDPQERALILCSVRDPGNLGSVIRSAVAFGVQHVILSPDCADIYNPKTVRSAMGSLFKIKISILSDLTEFILVARALGRRVFAAELTDGARSISDIGLRNDDIVMIGNEGHGIPREISASCSGSVYIPISEKTESLNASVAAAIFMWEQNKIN